MPHARQWAAVALSGYQYEDDRVTIAMNEPQVWTLIGVFAAGMFGMITVLSSLVLRTIRTEISGLRGELKAELGGLRGEMRAGFRGTNERLDRLDGDVNTLMKNAFGIDRG